MPEENASLSNRLQQLTGSVVPMTAKHSSRTTMWNDNFNLSSKDGEDSETASAKRFNLTLQQQNTITSQHFITTMAQHKRFNS